MTRPPLAGRFRMVALLARFRFVRWALLLLAASASVGCAAFHDYECEDDDYDTASYHRGGSVAPGALNLRAGYRNG